MKLTEKEIKTYKKRFIEKYEQKYGKLYIDGEYFRIMKLIEKAMKAELKKLSDIDVMGRKDKTAFIKNVMQYVDKNHNKGRLTYTKYLSLTDEECDEWLCDGICPTFFDKKETERKVDELLEDIFIEYGNDIVYDEKKHTAIAYDAFNEICQSYSVNGYIYIDDWRFFNQDLRHKLLDKLGIV